MIHCSVEAGGGFTQRIRRNNASLPVWNVTDLPHEAKRQTSTANRRGKILITDCMWISSFFPILDIPRNCVIC